MKLSSKDSTVAALAVLIVGVFVVAYASWNVPLIGDSNRWAAVVIVALGLIAGYLASPGSGARSYLLAGLVIVAFLFAVIALASASLTALALLVVALLALIVASTVRETHARRAASRDVDSRSGDEHCGSGHRAVCHPLQRSVRVDEGMNLHVGAHRYRRGELQELGGIPPRDIRDAADAALPPEQVVGELRDAIEVDRVDRDRPTAVEARSAATTTSPDGANVIAASSGSGGVSS